MCARQAAVLVGALAWVSTACWAPPPVERPGGPLSVQLVTPADAAPYVRITGWSSAELDALTRTGLTADALGPVASVHVAPDQATAIAVDYRVNRQGLELHPRYALDQGREYLIVLDASRPPVARQATRVETTVRVPVGPEAPRVRVTRIAPATAVWPENTLRFYLHFSGPMRGTSAVGHVRLVDDQDRTIPDVLLDIDVDLWNTDYTRRTVFFDPGRVKQDIRPNRELGRALVTGRRYAIVVDAGWTDAAGRPLDQEFRHEFTAAPPVEAGLEPLDWTWTPPRVGTREPLTVSFPWALDEGLLHRAIGVLAGDTAVAGTITVGGDQRSWQFTPSDPWAARPHLLAVLSILEDPSGNTVRQPFEFEMFGAPTPAIPERIVLPFTPTAGTRQSP